MSTRSRIGLVAAALAGAVLWLLWSARELAPLLPPPASAGAAAAAGDAADTGDVPVDADALRLPGATPPVEVEAADRPVLRVRLRGLVPAAPWTAMLRFDWRGRDPATNEWLRREERGTVAADGTARFRLSDRTGVALQQEWRIDADDPSYDALWFRREGVLDLTQELVLDVQARAVFEGRVVDGRGDGVPAARVTAFARRGSRPVAPQLGMTNTRGDGGYRIHVPPNVPLLLVATPMQPAHLSGRHMTGPRSVADLGVVRPDLLPATGAATGAFGATTTVPDIVLPDAARIVGVLQWPDGAPVARAKVAVGADGEVLGLEISPNTHVRADETGALSLAAVTWTGDDGTFELPVSPGTEATVHVVEVPQTRLEREIARPASLAPQRSVLTLPAPVVLRAVRGGAPVPGATIQVGDLPVRADGHGCLRLLARSGSRVRAREGRAASPWTEVGPALDGTTVDLPLTEGLTRVAIEFHGAFRVRNAGFRWLAEDRTWGLQYCQRDDSGVPFELFLDEGRYRLWISPAPGERNGVYLMPTARDLVVGATEVALDLPAEFGGKFELTVTDRDGLPVGARCRLRDATGAEHRLDFVDRRQRPGPGDGRLPADGVGTCDTPLPPGDYELEVTAPGRGTARAGVTILARQCVEVRLRLP